LNCEYKLFAHRGKKGCGIECVLGRSTHRNPGLDNNDINPAVYRYVVNPTSSRGQAKQTSAAIETDRDSMVAQLAPSPSEVLVNTAHL
jgi:hypothetical protein